MYKAQDLWWRLDGNICIDEEWKDLGRPNG